MTVDRQGYAGLLRQGTPRDGQNLSPANQRILGTLNMGSVFVVLTVSSLVRHRHRHRQMPCVLALRKESVEVSWLG